MSSPATERPKAGRSASSTRLDSWKEIASYLNRGERTVKRWEADRGLPVRRVPGAGRAAVYAYSAELDEWLTSPNETGLEAAQQEEQEKEAIVRSGSVADERQIAPTPADLPAQETAARRASRGPNWKLALAGMLAAAVLGATLYAVASRGKGRPVLNGVSSEASTGGTGTNRANSPFVSDQDKLLAHNLYLKGRYEWEQRTPASLNRALDDFTQSIVHDPGDAQAYAGLADTYDLLRQYAAMPDNDAFPRAIAAARKAIELDDSLEEAHRSLAFAEMYGAWDFAAAEKEFKRAIELDPKDAIARRWYANAFAAPGRYEEAFKQIDVAQELDPSSNATLADKGLMLYNAGRTEEAIALLKEVERSAPTFRSSHFYLMLIDLDLKDYPAYLAEGELTAKTSNDPAIADVVASAKAGYARAGDKGLLEGLYSKQKQYYLQGKLWGTILAKTCVLMGRRQEALQLLDDAYAHHEAEVFASFTNPDLFALKDEPRYQALVKKINFPAA